MAHRWRTALGADREPSPEQAAAVLAPITGHQVVNAGAGTGKTSTLALRAAYLVESGLVLASEIVVVTFTKKAAAEVGSRIADSIDRMAHSGASAVMSDHAVTCTTIHGLAAQILREFAFDLGARSPIRAISDGEAAGIFHESFRALLDGRLAVETAAFPLAEVDVAILERDLAKLAIRLKNHGITPAAFSARALAQADDFARQTWGQLWSPSGKNSAKRVNLSPREPVTVAERVAEAARERANVHVVSALLHDFDRRLDDRGAATYGDLIARATRLLRSAPAIVARLRRRWRYLLLDESQDTSALQLSFITTLFGAPHEPDAVGMMPVGDMRQAIYGFNGADERVMESLAQDADMVHALVCNRRSPQEIIDAADAVLANEHAADDAAKLVADRSAGLDCVRLQRFDAPGGSAKDHVALESAALAREIARLIDHEGATPADIAILLRRRTHATAYVRALNERGIVAALDRRSGLLAADEVRDAFAWTTLLVDLRDRAAAVRILQSPVCGLNDAAMIDLASRSDWLERTLTDRLDDCADVDTRARLGRMRAFVTRLLPAMALPVPAAVEHLLATIPIAATSVRLGPTIGAQAIINLRGLAELAREFAAERPTADLREFVDDIKRRIADDDDPPEPELELDGVRVLTIHQAKGLEWPYVFVACSTKFQYADTDPTDRVVLYDLASGALALKNDVAGRETFRWVTATCEHDPATGERRPEGSLKAARRRESARVSYVAVTRAQRRVYVTTPGKAEAGFVGAIERWAQTRSPGVRLDFDFPDALALETDVAPAEQQSPRDIVERRQPVVQAVAIQPRISFTALATYATCPRLARLRYRLLLPDLRDRSARFVGGDRRPDTTPASAARLGSLTHRALELWGAASIAAAPIACDEAVARAVHEFVDADPADIDEARTRAHHAVAALADYVLVAVESAFAVNVAGVWVEGSIDLIARDPDGALVVIDYKTGRTDDAEYALQLALYRRAVEQRYPGEPVSAAILRLTDAGATLTHDRSLSAAEVDQTVARAGHFESDVPNVGPWCESCAYRASPCTAPVLARAALEDG
jgi:ATP-dependent exoDNAse (exonuclease V) beta subunit